jgi:hypothetical protein
VEINFRDNGINNSIETSKSKEFYSKYYSFKMFMYFVNFFNSFIAILLKKIINNIAVKAKLIMHRKSLHNLDIM